METVVHRISDLAGGQRSAAEQLVGHPLHEDQQLVIQVVNLARNKIEIPKENEEGMLPDWCNVYEGLTDDEIDSLDRAITRLNLTRLIT